MGEKKRLWMKGYGTKREQREKIPWVEERGMHKDHKEKEFLCMRLPLIEHARGFMRSRKRVARQTKSVAASKKTEPWVRKKGFMVKEEGLWVRKKGLKQNAGGSKKKGCGTKKKGGI